VHDFFKELGKAARKSLAPLASGPKGLNLTDTLVKYLVIMEMLLQELGRDERGWIFSKSIRY